MKRNIRITPFGYRSISITLLVCFTLIIGGLLLPFPASFLIPSAAACFLLFTLYFYRDPEREVPAEKNTILAPADGTVVLMKKIDHRFTGSSSTLISIFMSPFNVHVNRIPVSGSVTHLRYSPGKFLMAFDERSMSENERMEIGIDTGTAKVLFCQVAGFLARRIVCTLKAGDAVSAGVRFGMIRFGSRVDVILPADVSVTVSNGTKTVSGVTVIGRQRFFSGNNA